jgi:hypothetical protein
MIGLPALAFAACAACAIVHYGRDPERRIYLVLSGVLLAFALQTKLLAVTLLPAMGLELVRIHWREGFDRKLWRRIAVPTLIWGVSILLVGVALALVLSPGLLGEGGKQLFSSHVEARKGLESSSIIDLVKLWRGDFDVLLLALFSVLALIRARDDSFFFPLVWLVTSFGLLVTHKPVWPHHYLYLSVPMVWLAALGAHELFHNGVGLLKAWFGKSKVSTDGAFAALALRVALLIVAIAVCLHLPGKFARMETDVARTGWLLDEELIKELGKYKRETNWILTDRPIYAYLIHAAVPPWVAVPSQKRLRSGQMSRRDIVDALDKYRPEMVLLNRFNFSKKTLVPRLADGYTPTYVRGKSQLFVRNDVVRKLSARQGGISPRTP